MSTSEDVQYIRRISQCMWGRYHSACGGDIMSTSGDVQYIGVFNVKLKGFHHLAPPHAS